MMEAEKACSGIPDTMMWKACVIDVCLNKNPGAAVEVAAAEVLKEKVNTRGIPVFVGHGRCVDEQGSRFRVLRTKGVRSFADCMALLRTAAGARGVLGAQLQVE